MLKLIFISGQQLNFISTSECGRNIVVTAYGNEIGK